MKPNPEQRFLDAFACMLEWPEEDVDCWDDKKECKQECYDLCED